MVEHAPRGDAVNTVVTFSSLPPSDQFDAWHDAVSKAFVPLDATSRTDGAFGGVLANRAVGPVQISDVAGGAVDVYRSARAIRRFDPGYLKLGMQLRGYCLVTQDDREAPLTPGDFALYDTRPDRAHVRAFQRSARPVRCSLLGATRLRVVGTACDPAAGPHPADQGIHRRPP